MERSDNGAAGSALERMDILLVGAGPMLAMLEAALQKLANVSLRVCLTASQAAPDSGAAEPAWDERVPQADWVLFGSGEPDLAELRALDQACRRAGKPLLPGITIRGSGLAGPLSVPGAGCGWEAAWRRIRPDALGLGGEPRSDTLAEAMLVNVMLAEWRRRVSQEDESALLDHIYLLDLESLEGRLHSFLPHPAAGCEPISPLRIDAGRLLRSKPAAREKRDLLPVFERLTSPVAGIFHEWDEGDLAQLPLSQCRVQTADPLSTSGSGLLPQLVCAELTHLEARREAGLAGIEAYAARLASSSGRISPERVAPPIEELGIGAGATVPEAFNRALSMALDRSMMRAARSRAVKVRELRIDEFEDVEDVHCRYCLRALAAMREKPAICAGDAIWGFPTVWVRAGERWYGAAGLNRTLALRSALQRAVMREASLPPDAKSPDECDIRLEAADGDAPQLDVCGTDGLSSSRLSEAALHTLDANRCRLSVFDLAAEPFLKNEFAGVFGVLLEEETE